MNINPCSILNNIDHGSLEMIEVIKATEEKSMTYIKKLEQNNKILENKGSNYQYIIICLIRTICRSIPEEKEGKIYEAQLLNMTNVIISIYTSQMNLNILSKKIKKNMEYHYNLLNILFII